MIFSQRDIDMRETRKWTIRKVDEEAIEAIQNVAEASDISFGEAVSEAIMSWYSGLPEVGTLEME